MLVFSLMKFTYNHFYDGRRIICGESIIGEVIINLKNKWQPYLNEMVNCMYRNLSEVLALFNKPGT